MIITNRMNLPESMVEFMKNHFHENEPNRFSVTSLLKGSLEAALIKMHGDEVEQDVSDLIFALFGTAVHSLLEKQETEGAFNEVPLEYEVMPGIYWTGISDNVDLKERKIKDYKTASVWKIKMGDFEDWRNQLRDYCVLVKLTYGEDIRDGQIIAMLKDHSKTEAKRDINYPQSPVYVCNFHYTEEELDGRLEEVKEKILEILDIEIMLNNGNELPEKYRCSDKEVWARPSKYALMKEGRKSAIRLYDTEEEATQALEGVKGGYIEFRQGERVKCNGYCSVNGFCPFYNKEN